MTGEGSGCCGEGRFTGKNGRERERGDWKDGGEEERMKKCFRFKSLLNVKMGI